MMSLCWIAVSFFVRQLGAGILLAVLLTMAMRVAHAADFAVSPMVVEFGRGIRSAEITVRNLDQQPIRFQVRGADWRQDASGKNVYVDSKTLIWFPRALELAPGEARIIRVGVRATPAAQEQAYTLFLKEVAVAGPDSGRQTGAEVKLVLSVSVPIFVPPVKAVPGGAIESIELHAGRLEFVVANGGNQHLGYREAAIVGRGPDGSEQFSQKLPGRMLLAGARQRYQVQIPQAACAQLKELAVTLTIPEKNEIKRGLDVSRADCQ
ncbi:MAG: molecular chaperone [Pseudomonadota bacterium]|nr:MAG: molecular chaperone [Pseudomonadota bacterium]